MQKVATEPSMLVCEDESNLFWREGWGLFCVDMMWEGEPILFLEINKIDDRDVFESDRHAILYVRKMADAGSEIHQRALALNGTIVHD